MLRSRTQGPPLAPSINSLSISINLIHIDTYGSSSTGRALVSKTGGCRFDFCLPCQNQEKIFKFVLHNLKIFSYYSVGKRFGVGG